MILGQDHNKELLNHAVKSNVPTLLIGDTGTGKTSIIRELAKDRGHELIRVNLTGQTSTDEFVGKWLLEDNQTKWQDGVLTQAMKKGYWIVVDEINAALPEILFVLHSLLDDDRRIMLAEKDGELVTPFGGFRFFATMNPEEEYAGTKELNKALISRFGVVLRFEYPEPKDEVKILMHRSKLKEQDAKLLVQFGVKARELKHDEAIYYTCSTRDLIFWAEMSPSIGMESAFEVAVLNKASGDEKKLVDIYKENIGNVVDEIKAQYKVNLIGEVIDEFEKKEKDLRKQQRELTKERKAFKGVKDKALTEALRSATLDAATIKELMKELKNKLLGGKKKRGRPKSK